MRQAALFCAAATAVLSACREAPRCPSDWCGTAVLVSSEPGVLLPPVTETDADFWITEMLFSKLAELGPGLNTVGDAGFVPELAESWTWENPTTLRFTLNPQARWHDGRPVTAQDVAFTFEVYRDSLVNASARPVLEQIASVTAADARTAVFRFRRSYPEAFFDAAYQMWILPQHILDTVPRGRFSSHPFGRSPTGSGPFRFKAWVTGQHIELAGDSSYFLGRPGLRRVLWRFIPDMAAGVTQLVAGEADGAQALVTPELLERLRGAPQLNLTPFVLSAYAYIGFNLRAPGRRDSPHPLFSDRDLRRAVAMSVDRDAVVRAVLGELGDVPSGPFAPWLWIARESPPPLPFDTAAANAALDSLGWRRGADDLRVRNGRRLEFDLLVPTSSGLRRRAAVIVQEHLKRVGISMQITEMDFNAMIDRAAAGRFDAAFLSWVSDPSPRSIRQTWSTAGFAGSNYARYDNPTFDRLTDQAVGAQDRARAAALWHQAMSVINADAPAIWIYAPRPVLAAHRRFLDADIRPDLWTALLWKWRVNPDALIERDLVVVP
jgi:peptide/nickel transport system substrate-binding protein